MTLSCQPNSYTNKNPFLHPSSSSRVLIYLSLHSERLSLQFFPLADCLYPVALICVHAELYSLQGMEFLEGFGKKKQQPNQQSNNISSVHINPLTAQSLNIHLHGIFDFFSSLFAIHFFKGFLFF